MFILLHFFKLYYFYFWKCEEVSVSIYGYMSHGLCIKPRVGSSIYREFIYVA